jgi:hypothetical protein
MRDETDFLGYFLVMFLIVAMMGFVFLFCTDTGKGLMNSLNNETQVTNSIEGK